MKKISTITWVKQAIPFLVMFAGAFMGFPLANAQNSNGLIPAPTNIISTPTDVKNLFCAVLGWMFWGLIVLAVAMFLVGGYTYATASGESEKIGKANKILLYAAIALVVGFIAQGVPSLISSFFGTGALNACG